jgi:uncharacterized protein (TIGR02246 family)
MMKFATAILITLALISTALADSENREGKVVSEAFQKACAAGDIPGVMALYEDDATAIWPGQGEVAKGKEEIEKLATSFCKPNGALKFRSQESKPIGNEYILNIGSWEDTLPGADGNPSKVEVRTTELLHYSGGKWRYLVDHASIGLPLPSQAGAAGVKASP